MCKIPIKQTKMKKISLILFLLVVFNPLLFSQNDLLKTVNQKVGEINDTIYSELEIGLLTYAKVNTNYTVRKYNKYLYVLKVEDIRLKKYIDDINIIIKKRFIQNKINVISFSELEKLEKIDTTSMKYLMEQNQIDGLITITFGSSQSLHSNWGSFGIPSKSLSTTTIVDFFDKEYTMRPYISVKAGADSHYFKPVPLSDKAISNTIRGLIRQKLLIPNLD